MGSWFSGAEVVEGVPGVGVAAMRIARSRAGFFGRLDMLSAARIAPPLGRVKGLLGSVDLGVEG